MYSLDRLLRAEEKNVRYRRQRFTGSIWTEIMLVSPGMDRRFISSEYLLEFYWPKVKSFFLNSFKFLQIR